MLTALNWSCICTGFYMQTVPGVGGPQASEHWNTLTPAQDTTGQNHGPPADHVQSLGLGMCTPNPYWARDNRTTGISGTCTNRTDKHNISHSERGSNSVDRIHSGLQRPKSTSSLFPPMNFTCLSSGVYFHLNLIHFKFKRQKSPANITAMIAFLNVGHKHCLHVDTTAYTEVTLQKWRWKLKKWE